MFVLLGPLNPPQIRHTLQVTGGEGWEEQKKTTMQYFNAKLSMYFGSNTACVTISLNTGDTVPWLSAPPPPGRRLGWTGRRTGMG